MNERQQNYFAYISISEMTHDWTDAGHYLDVPYHTLLNTIFGQNLVDNTVIIFFSDHGFRYGELRKTHVGELESRLPFIFIHIPESVRARHSHDWLKHLEVNQHRLTTPFDVHATLTHLVNGMYESAGTLYCVS